MSSLLLLLLRLLLVVRIVVVVVVVALNGDEDVPKRQECVSQPSARGMTF
jgi:hypothetical protein